MVAVRKRKSEKMNLFQKQTLVWGGIGVIAFTFIANSVKADTQVQDHYKNVIHKIPSNVEVCYDRQVSGDKTGDTIMGAILGGAIGNNVTKNVDNGGAVGALLGGMLGHSNSKSTGGTRQVCNIETRYNESRVEVYSHSVVTFRHNGKMYSLKFQK